MNNDTIAGNWKQLMGDIQKQWGKLTDDHLTQVMDGVISGASRSAPPHPPP